MYNNKKNYIKILIIRIKDEIFDNMSSFLGYKKIPLKSQHH